MNVRRTGFLLLFTFLTCISFAQRTVINGTVIDKETREPLPFISIQIKGTGAGTLTDSTGTFSLESKKSGDSILVSGTGYKKQTIFIRKNEVQRIDIFLEPESFAMKEVMIRPGKNPAFIILDSVLANRSENGNAAIDCYQWESYEKFQIYFGNYTDHFSKRKQFKNFKYIFDYADTAEGGRPIMPIFMSETITEKYSCKEPPLKKEILLADKSTIEKYDQLTAIADKMVENIDIYQNFFLILDKSFISPVNNNYPFYYRYYLTDSMQIDGNFCYKIEFKPKWKSDFAFSGDLFIDSKTWAVVKFQMKANDEINLNYLKDIQLGQQFKQVENKWILTKSSGSATVRFMKNMKNNEFTIRKNSSWDKIVINKSEVIHQSYKILSADSTADPYHKTDDYWKHARHDSLSPKEKYNYTVADTIRFVPIAKQAKLFLTMLGTGYISAGKISIGQYASFYSVNPVEDQRFKFGFRTNKYFNPKFQFGGYAAYGKRDKEIKYKASLLYVPVKDDGRLSFGASYKYDLSQIGVSKNLIPFDNILTSLTGTSSLGKLTFNREAQVYAQKFWTKNFSTQIGFTNTEIRPLGELRFQKLIDANPTIVQYLHDLTISEINLNVRFSFKENYYAGEFVRRSLGSPYPIINVDFTAGIKNLLGSDYNYQKLKINLRGKQFLNPFGYLNYNLESGKVFGQIPYLLLTLHPGNQTLIYDQEAFNMMKYFEFASDEYVSLHLDHHFEGFFLNKIPGVRKAKLREVISARTVVGNLHESNRTEMILPAGMMDLSKPYLECSAGLENIFKVFRVDYVWRMNYKSPVASENWSIKGQFSISF